MVSGDSDNKQKTIKEGESVAMSVPSSLSPKPSDVPGAPSQSPAPSTSGSIFQAANKALENLRDLFSEDKAVPVPDEEARVMELTRSISPDDLAKMSPEHRRLFAESLLITQKSLPKLGFDSSKKALGSLLETVQPRWQAGVINKQPTVVQQTWKKAASPSGERRSPSPLGSPRIKTSEVAAATKIHQAGGERTEQVQALAAFMCANERLWNYEWVFRKEGDRELTKKFHETLKATPPSKYQDVITRLLEDASPAGTIELAIALKRLSSDAMKEADIRRSTLEQRAPALRDLLTLVARSEKTKMGPEADPDKTFPLSRLDKMFPVSQHHMHEARIGDHLEKLLVVLHKNDKDPRYENFHDQFSKNLDTLLDLVKEAPPKALRENPVLYEKLLELASLLSDKGQKKAISAALKAAAKAVSD